MNINETTEKLEIILSAIEDTSLRDELFHRFFLENPLEVARHLHSLDIPDAVKAKVLALKVGMPQPYKGVDLEPLISRAMEQMWARLGEAKV